MSDCTGTLYGVSVGPGDPELITVKSKKVLERCPVLALPETHKGNSLALTIAGKVIDLSHKELLPLRFPMLADQEQLRLNYEAHAARLEQVLSGGQDVAFICLGDVSVFSTFAYIGKILIRGGYSVVMLPGVTSFCASACALGVSLTAANQPLHIIPAGYGDVDGALELPGAKVLMKSASQFPAVRRAVLASGQPACAAVDCGLDSQRLYHDLADMPEESGYFTTIIVKETL
ncbi:MAG: precorrin-2 C(20)-methyltransferase [Candidatus Pelethousia sp.]|nr:precorrin-2 C(20)-methyltransferase [Candidatus Pelethousia sp.]